MRPPGMSTGHGLKDSVRDEQNDGVADGRARN
jgi:hypothetical protein